MTSLLVDAPIVTCTSLRGGNVARFFWIVAPVLGNLPCVR